jgi:hypothetical protein
MTVSPLDSEFDLALAIAAVAHWVDPAPRQVAAIREGLVFKDRHSITTE